MVMTASTTRRRCKATTSCFILLLLTCHFLPFHCTPDSFETPSRPNVILLFVDDLGYGDVGFNGHPTTQTPHLDRLAANGKILTSWYSGCHVCTGSRTALMTGRQFLRAGMPGVLGPSSPIGLPLRDRTIAEQLKKAGYTTAACGKWHLGDRKVYLPGSRGFDYYLGIPYSDDMGNGRQSSCPPTDEGDTSVPPPIVDPLEGYAATGMLEYPTENKDNNDPPPPDPAADNLPLLYQEFNTSTVLQQPVDFTTLTQKYNDFILRFLHNATTRTNNNTPFFLYVPFSHVHTTHNTPLQQYAGCDWNNATRRGPFGNALAEVDWMVGNIVNAIEKVSNNTLIIFTSDNGPWLVKGLSGGSAGLLTGRFAGYWDTGKGTTWEGGIRMPAFAYWKNKIQPHSRSSETISSLDVFPTLSALAGIPLPVNRTFDGKDISSVLLRNGPSPHDFLFFYGTCDPQQSRTQHKSEWGVSAVRHGKYKAHFCTGPGLSRIGTPRVYHKYPLLFDIDQDPSESIPISNGTMPDDPEHAAAMERILKAHAMEIATFVYGVNTPEPDGPGEGPGRYGVCCDRSRECNCDALGWGNVGSRLHHDAYHKVLGQDEPFPAQTRAQAALRAL